MNKGAFLAERALICVCQKAVDQIAKRTSALLDGGGRPSRGLHASAQGFGGGQRLDVSQPFPGSTLERFPHVFLGFVMVFRNEKAPGLTRGSWRRWLEGN